MNDNGARRQIQRKCLPQCGYRHPLFGTPSNKLIPFLVNISNFLNVMRKINFLSIICVGWPHHEFGVTHKPSRSESEKESPGVSYGTKNINYWLPLWCDSDEFLLSTMPKKSILVFYEKVSADPEAVLAEILGQSGITIHTGSLNTSFRGAKRKEVEGINESLEAEAFDLYRRMSENEATG